MGKNTGQPIPVISYFPQKGDSSLTFVEGNVHIPFDIKRVFWVNVNEYIDGSDKRGFHAHKTCRQVMFCIAGEIRVELFRLREDKTIEWEAKLTLGDGSPGILIEPYTYIIYWSYQERRSSIALVFASEQFDPDDYILPPE